MTTTVDMCRTTNKLVGLRKSISFFLGLPGGSWRSGDDLSKLYDRVTPNPTGSLSGPYFDQDIVKNVVGVKGKTTHLACRIKNLGNYTVRIKQLAKPNLG